MIRQRRCGHPGDQQSLSSETKLQLQLLLLLPLPPILARPLCRYERISPEAGRLLWQEAWRTSDKDHHGPNASLRWREVRAALTASAASHRQPGHTPRTITPHNSYGQQFLCVCLQAWRRRGGLCLCCCPCICSWTGRTKLMYAMPRDQA